MRKLLTQVVSLGVLAALIAVAAAPVRADEPDYEMPGRFFGGVDVGVMQPVNAFNNYTQTGGLLAPFVGYKLFQDRDKQLNIGLLAQGQFIAAGSQACGNCIFGRNDETVYGLGGTIGPRVSVPIGPTETYAMWGVGFIEGLTNPSALAQGSWGWSTGGGINYSLNDNVMIGPFGRYNIFYQYAHDIGYVRYVTAGLGVTIQESPAKQVAAAPPPPPPPPAAAPAPVKKKIVLRGVNFDFDKYNIRPDAVPILEQACSILKQDPNIDVVCRGYTDGIGTVAYNLTLSDHRANAVRDWLVKCGVQAKRLTSKGFGKSDPVATNATPEGRAQNRRTELVVAP